MRSFLLLLTVLMICSCIERTRGVWRFPNTPSAEFPRVLANATPDFRQGWDDGCQVGTSTGSNTFYKFFYKSNAADGYKMTSSPDYKAAWSGAFWYCYRYIYVKNKSSIWGSMMNGYK